MSYKTCLLCLKSAKHLNNCFFIRNISFICISRHKRINGLVFQSKSQNTLQLTSKSNPWPQLTSFAVNLSSTTQPLDASTYERIADQTLDHLSQELEDIIESNDDLKDSDICLNNGVLTLNLGFHGIYVINKQTPNKQIWFSSPVSGPKRYDYMDSDWLYKRDGISLNSTLSSELSMILNREIKIKPLFER